jgi:hypothetical protein
MATTIWVKNTEKTTLGLRFATGGGVFKQGLTTDVDNPDNEWWYDALNGHPRDQTAAQLAAEYYARGNHSLSVGDLIQRGNQYWEANNLGWRKLNQLGDTYRLEPPGAMLSLPFDTHEEALIGLILDTGPATAPVTLGWGHEPAGTQHELSQHGPAERVAAALGHRTPTTAEPPSQPAQATTIPPDQWDNDHYRPGFRT